MADVFHYSKGASCAIRERALKFFLHRITVYLHSCEIAFLIENQICKTLSVFFFLESCLSLALRRSIPRKQLSPLLSTLICIMYGKEILD